MSDSLRVVPTGAALGADIEGVDLRDLSDADFAKIEQAWHGHLVLRFRGQELDDDSLAVDATAEVGPGGHFFGAAHTLARYETAFYAILKIDAGNQ